MSNEFIDWKREKETLSNKFDRYEKQIRNTNSVKRKKESIKKLNVETKIFEENSDKFIKKVTSDEKKEIKKRVKHFREEIERLKKL